MVGLQVFAGICLRPVRPAPARTPMPEYVVIIAGHLKESILE